MRDGRLDLGGGRGNAYKEEMGFGVELCGGELGHS